MRKGHAGSPLIVELIIVGKIGIDCKCTDPEGKYV